MKYIVRGKEIYAAGGLLKDSSILVNGNTIEEVGAGEKEGYEKIDLRRYRILPGLIDMHIHGANGFDTMDANYRSLNEISKYLARTGVTSFLATTVTDRLDNIENAAANVADSMEKGLSGARLLGLYIEGPYIAGEYKGAHPEEYIRPINLDEIKNIVEKSRNTVKVVAIAPEKEGSAEAIKYLVSKGIKVSLGHTNATYAEAVEAIEKGATIAVHIYNGMRGLHHREPGMLGAALNNDNIKVELICDGVHVAVPAVEIVLRCKDREDIILITDCIRAGGLEDGEYILGKLKVNVRGGIARIDNGSLAGSTLKLIKAIENIVEMAGVTFEDALKMATINPAMALGLDKEIGSIQEGKRADIVAINDDYDVVFTMVDGKVVYSKDGGY